MHATYILSLSPFADSMFKLNKAYFTSFFVAIPDQMPENSICTFENGWCGWTKVNMSANKIAWERTNRPQSTDKTGPKYDHTFGNSSGKFADQTNHNNLFVWQSLSSMCQVICSLSTWKHKMLHFNKLSSVVLYLLILLHTIKIGVLDSLKAVRYIFVLETLDHTIHYFNNSIIFILQLRFFYHMFGEHVESLDVELILINPRNTWAKPIRFCERKGNQGNLWLRASCKLPSIKGSKK